MKKLMLIVTALTISITSFSQKKEVASKVIIAGNLKNYDAKEIRVYTGESGVTSSIEAGDFKISFDSEETKIYNIWIVPSISYDANYPDRMEQISRRSRFLLFLSPGDSIYISADFNDFKDTFKLSGGHEAENMYLFEKQHQGNLHAQSGLIDWWPFINLDKDRLFSKKDSLFNAAKIRFTALKTATSVDPAFLKLEEAYFQYEPLVFDLHFAQLQVKDLNQLNTGGEYFITLGRKDSLAIIILIETIIGNHIMYKMREDSKDFPISKIDNDLAKVDLSRSDLLSSLSYTSLINARIDDAMREILAQATTLKKDDTGYEKARMMAIDQLLTNQAVKDHYRYSSIKPNLDYRGPAYVKVDYDKFMKEHQSPKLAAKLKESYEKWDTILPGMDVPDFSFEDIEGNSRKLSDLRGKLIYIDIWATWCGPCIAEHPHWDNLREEYKDKPVSFLTISVDTKKEVWQKMVTAKNMEGLQWYAQGDFKSELARHFKVKAIPRFLLLDQEGKIIDPSADRPSGNIRAMLDQHL
jgi:thiol-disulfide isomerase/thioredoxin